MSPARRPVGAAARRSAADHPGAGQVAGTALPLLHGFRGGADAGGRRQRRSGANRLPPQSVGRVPAGRQCDARPALRASAEPGDHSVGPATRLAVPAPRRDRRAPDPPADAAGRRDVGRLAAPAGAVGADSTGLPIPVLRRPHALRLPVDCPGRGRPRRAWPTASSTWAKSAPRPARACRTCVTQACRIARCSGRRPAAWWSSPTWAGRRCATCTRSVEPGACRVSRANRCWNA